MRKKDIEKISANENEKRAIRNMGKEKYHQALIAARAGWTRERLMKELKITEHQARQIALAVDRQEETKKKEAADPLASPAMTPEAIQKLIYDYATGAKHCDLPKINAAKALYEMVKDKDIGADDVPLDEKIRIIRGLVRAQDIVEMLPKFKGVELEFIKTKITEEQESRVRVANAENDILSIIHRVGSEPVPVHPAEPVPTSSD